MSSPKDNQMEMINSSHTSIAIVGVGCRYPGAASPKQLWENVLARRQEFRSFLDQRLPLADYQDLDPDARDKVYAKRAAYIDGFDFDWAKMRIPKSTFESTDIAQWLALDVAIQSIEDAGYSRESILKESTGVVVGNSLTGEQSRATTMRLRWPFVRRVLSVAWQANNLPKYGEVALADVMEYLYKSAFPEITEDTLAGGLSNTIAGRIANYFDLHGGGYVVDGACASSLLAVSTAADNLVNHNWDMAIAGGVDVSLDTFELVGFSKATALARDEMNVYDKRGAGFIPGEGCGFVVLKRLEDARAAGDTIYAVLRGWGVSSDGKGGITAPSSKGQSTALLRAYAKAGYSPHELDFVEGHGTGTKVGDRVELQGIAATLNAFGLPSDQSCGVTSFKSIVGHTKAAAGIGAFIKAILAVNRRILPPTAGCKERNPVFNDDARMLFPILQGEILSPSKTVRAGVSAMGFGGINTHVTLESDEPPSPKFAPDIAERALLFSDQDSEILVFGAHSTAELRVQLQELADMTASLSLGDLVDLAAYLGRALELEESPHVRAAIIVSRPDHAAERLRWLVAHLENKDLSDGELYVSPQKDIWVGHNVQKKRLGFLLPGQGSQQLSMARVIVGRFAWARELVDRLDHYTSEELGKAISPMVYHDLNRVTEDELRELERALTHTEVAQPAICLASVLYARYLEHLGLQPSVLGGHSLGELTAFHLAGAFDEEALFRFAARRGKAMASVPDEAGAMASLACSPEQAEALTARVDGYVVVANINSPRQVVVSGEDAAISDVLTLAEHEGIDHRLLRVFTAFHSQLVEGAAEILRHSSPLPKRLGELSAALISSTDGTLIAPGLDLHEHFTSQFVRQVQFVQLVERMHQECDLIIEVGPGRILSGLVDTILESHGKICLPVASRPGSARDLNLVLAQAFVHGVDCKWEALYEGRLVRPFVPTAARTFIDNPCERPLAPIESAPRSKIKAPLGEHRTLESALLEGSELAPTELQNYLSHRGEFLVDLVRSDQRWFAIKEKASAPKASSIAEPLARLPVKEDPVIERVEPSHLATATQSGTAETTESARSEFAAKPFSVVANAAASESAASSSLSVEELLLDEVTRRTGFPEESISLDLRLLDDLNLDSIKAGELVASVAKAVGVAGKLDPSQFAAATLSEVVEAIQAAGGEVAAQAMPEVTNVATSESAAPSSLSIEALLLDEVTRRTGFPGESISLDLRLLDDLNLDSIKAGELVASVAKAVGVAGKLDPSQFAAATLSEVVEVIQAAGGETAAQAMPEVTNVATSESAAPSSLSIEALLLDEVTRRTGFPEESISLDLRLLDDLNLDSIKAGELISSVAKEAGVAGQLDPSRLANAKLVDVAVAIRDAHGEPDHAVLPGDSETKVEVPANRPRAVEPIPPVSEAKGGNEPENWVRNFAIQYLHEPKVNEEPTADVWHSKPILVLADGTNARVAGALLNRLTIFGAQVTIRAFRDQSLQSEVPRKHFSHVIAVLPETAYSQRNGRSELFAMLERAHTTVQLAVAHQSTAMAFVQFGGGRFGDGAERHELEVCGVASFARSVHLDHPELQVRVVDLSGSIEPGSAAQLILRELSGSESFAAVGYESEARRLVPRAVLQEPALYPKRELSWAPDGVVLVTGGAKGITAECALNLARTTSNKFALVGSSPAPRPEGKSNSEVGRTLERFAAEGLICRYYECDLTNAANVRALVKQVRAELGTIQVVVHGAGMNKAHRVEQVTLDDALSEVSPKLLGAMHLTQALEDSPPTLFVGLTSIIGVAGMAGNAWYAFSNEVLNLLLRRFEAAHPETNVVSIAYSVWAEAGMGVRMGVIDRLAKIGVGAIPTKEGVRRFVQLVEGDPGEKQVVVTAAMSGLDTWKMLSEPLPAPTKHRFVEQIAECEPGVALVTKTRLTADRDQYLVDHDFRGSLLFPTVFGLEAMAQVTLYLTGEAPDAIAHIEDINLRRPIVVDPEEGVEIELCALAHEQTLEGERKVQVGIRTEQSGFESDHFSATLVLGTRREGAKENLPRNQTPLALDPHTDLYGGLLFQGPLFQRMGSIYALDSARVVFEVEAKASFAQSEDGFAPGRGSAFVLGDPFFRDVLLQSVQLPLAPDIVLPVQIGRLERFLPAEGVAGHCVVNVSITGREDQEFIADVLVSDELGNPCERLTGYRVRILEEHPQAPTAEQLANPGVQDERHLQHLVTTHLRKLGFNPPAMVLGYLPELHALNKAQRHVHERPLIIRAVAEQLGNDAVEPVDVKVGWHPCGKPHLSGAITESLDLSLTHDDHYCLCIVGPGPQGCDLAPVISRAAEDRIALLGMSREPIITAMTEYDEPVDQAATRVWAAVEAVRKAAGAPQEVELSISKVQGEAVLLEAQVSSGIFSVLTMPIALTRQPQRILALVVASAEACKPSPEPASLLAIRAKDFYAQTHGNRFIYDEQRSQSVYEYLFQPAFKDCGNLSRGVFFSSYLLAIGKVRELFMAEIGPQLVEQIATGEWGLVTNWAELQITGNANSYDRLLARFRLGEIQGAVIPLHCDFYKILADKSLEQIAHVAQETTWVRVTGHGQVTPATFPAYLADFMVRMGSKKGNGKENQLPTVTDLPVHLDLGALRYSAPQNPGGLPVLACETFKTSLEDSNLVGNVYYANYFIWQGRVRDLFFHAIAPDLMQGVGENGEALCLRSRLNYLRDAMPFDEIQVEMALRSAWDNGALLQFSYFRNRSDGGREKLAVGEQEIAWVQGLATGNTVAMPLPEVLASALMEYSPKMFAQDILQKGAA